jgi:hypothetical protein
VKRQLAVVIAHRKGGKENIARQISETVRNRTHVHINFFLRMADTMTSQNIDLSSWDSLYNVHYDSVWPVEGKERLVIFDEVCYL